MKRIAILFFFLHSTFFALCSLAVSDEAVKELCRNASNAIMTAETEDAKQAAFDKQTALWAKKNNPTQLTAEQIEMLFQYGGLPLEKYSRAWLEPVLADKATKQTDMAFLRWKFMPENDGFMHSDKETKALIEFLNAKDLQSQLNAHSDYAQDIFAALSTMKDANWQTEGFPSAIANLLKCKLSEAATLDCVKAFNSIARVDTIDADSRNSIREACLAQYKTLLSSLDIPRKQKACREQIAYLEGPFACGTLIGGKAPELHFIRTFRQTADSVSVSGIKSLDELKGKVVLIDFWGTKCVPCIQSFPEMAELKKHFKGKDVVIMGVTSLMGYFADMPNHKTIQCRNNPEKEMNCFPPYMKANGIIWDIAISEEDVMNTDYGVLAIPHVTIIDRNGIVRHNAVNASNEEKIRIIEELLK